MEKANDFEILKNLDLSAKRKEELAELRKLARLENWHLAKSILLFIAIVGGCFIFPNLAQLIKFFDYKFDSKHRRQGRYQTKKTIENLAKKGWLDFKKVDDKKYQILLTTDGELKTYNYKIPHLKISIQKKWDGKWRMIIFDIPEKFKIARDILRERLKLLGFIQLQKSVWVHPYPCWSELKELVSICNVSPFVRLVEVSDYDDDTKEELKSYFNLNY